MALEPGAEGSGGDLEGSGELGGGDGVGGEVWWRAVLAFVMGGWGCSGNRTRSG